MDSAGANHPTVNWYDVAKERMLEIGLSPQNWTNRVIVAAALERGVRVTKSKRRGNVVLRHRGRRHWWRDGLSSLNTPLVRRMVKHKDVLSSYLLARGLPALRNQVFAENEADRAWDWGKEFGPLVVKPVDATGGKLVHVDLRTKAQFEAAFIEVAEHYGRVLVEEFRQGQEYRFLTVRNRVVAVCERRPAHVVGDGRRTIQQLVDRKNDERWRAPSHKKLQLGVVELKELSKQGLSPRSRPELGQTVPLRATSNIHTGGDAVDVTEDIDTQHIEEIERASRAIREGWVLGFDVILPSPGNQGQLVIVEVNAGPMISLHHLPWEGQPRNVAGAIVDAMFARRHRRRGREYWIETEEVSARSANDVQPVKVGWKRKINRRLAQLVKRN